MGIFSRRDKAVEQARQDRVTVASVWMGATDRKPWKGSPQDKAARDLKTTRRPRGWL